MSATDQVVALRKVNGTGGANEDAGPVYFHSTRVDENISAVPIEIKMPVTNAKQGSGIASTDRDAGTMYYDLKRYVHKFTLTGLLVGQSIGGTSYSAKTLKDYIYNKIFITKGDILLTWRNQRDYDYHKVSVIGESSGTPADTTYIHCFLETAKFTDYGKRAQTQDVSPEMYDTTIVLTRGLTRF